MNTLILIFDHLQALPLFNKIALVITGLALLYVRYVGREVRKDVDRLNQLSKTLTEQEGKIS